MTGADLIATERQRQITDEGFDPERDDQYTHGQLIDASLSYVRAAINPGHPALLYPPREWPWTPDWWKPTHDPIRDLIKAGALIAAEIDRLQRLA